MTLLIVIPMASFTAKADPPACTGRYSGGGGTPVAPFVIESYHDLECLSSRNGDWSRDFRQTVDITVPSDADWNPIGLWQAGLFPIPFTGSYDGQGNSISGLSIEILSSEAGAGGFGLFGLVRDAEVLDLTLEDAEIEVEAASTTSQIGLLIGRAENSTVRRVNAAGLISGDASVVGGLIGHVDEYTDVDESTTDVAISGGSSNASVGGLIGFNAGIVEKSQSRGLTSGLTNVGGLVGFNASTGEVRTESQASGSTQGSDYVGGLVGINYGMIRGATASGEVSGDEYVGGLVGASLGNVTVEPGIFGVVSDSSSSGDVSGVKFVGGLVGEANSDAQVLDSRATGAVDGTEDYVGGLVGRLGSFDPEPSYSAVANSSATGSVQGQFYVGGLVGVSEGQIRNSYATGEVVAFSGPVGGLIGELGLLDTDIGEVETSRAHGDVRVTGPFGSSIGGLIGRMFGGDVDQSFATGNLDGYSIVGGLVGHLVNGRITNSYAMGNVGHGSPIPIDWGGGGFAGLVEAGQISHSYSTGSVSGSVMALGGFIGEDLPDLTTSIERSFASGITNLDLPDNPSFVGLPFSTEGFRSVAQMKRIETFEGWSISSTWTSSGTWTICTGQNSGFPFLSGFFSTNPCVAPTPPAPAPSPSSDTPDPSSASPGHSLPAFNQNAGVERPSMSVMGTQIESTSGELRLVLSEVRRMTPSALRRVTPEQLAALPWRAFAELTPEQVQVLTTKQVTLLRAAQIRSIRPQSLRAMPPRVLGNLRASQIRALSPSQVRALRPVQIAALDPRRLDLLLLQP